MKKKGDGLHVYLSKNELTKTYFLKKLANVSKVIKKISQENQ